MQFKNTIPDSNREMSPRSNKISLPAPFVAPSPRRSVASWLRAYVPSCLGLRAKPASGLLLALSLLGGCGSDHVATTQPSTQPIATDIDPAIANPSYWYAQPGVASVPAGDYDKLWYACERAIRGRRFAPDRMDYRDGVMTSEPLVSKQFWELWRSDVVDSYDMAQASIGTHRRTIRFELTRSPDGACTAVPKVVVERFTAPDRRITVANNYRAAVSPSERTASRSPQSMALPGVHRWYALGRDPALEKALAEDVQDFLTH